MIDDVIPVAELTNFVPCRDVGQSQYRHVLHSGLPVDALLVNKESDVLVVSLHGALDRRKNTLPRFERLATLLQFDVSSIYFADPSLHLSDGLELAWLTGPADLDFHEVLADWSVRAAEAVGARKIIFSGSSGEDSQHFRPQRSCRAVLRFRSTHRRPSTAT